MAADVELAPRRQGLNRQRLPAFVVFVAAVAVVVALSGQSWAELRIEGADDAAVELEMEPSGRVVVDRTDEDADDSLRAAYLDDSLMPQRTALQEAVSPAPNEIARVLAAIVGLVALAGCMRDLTAPTWVLMASAALACLVLVATVRDRLLAALANQAVAVDLGPGDASPTVWGAIAIAGATAAALAAGAAAGPRPVRRRAAAVNRSAGPGRLVDEPDVVDGGGRAVREPVAGGGRATREPEPVGSESATIVEDDLLGDDPNADPAEPAARRRPRIGGLRRRRRPVAAPGDDVG